MNRFDIINLLFVQDTKNGVFDLQKRRFIKICDIYFSSMAC